MTLESQCMSVILCEYTTITELQAVFFPRVPTAAVTEDCFQTKLHRQHILLQFIKPLLESIVSQENTLKLLVSFLNFQLLLYTVYWTQSVNSLQLFHDKRIGVMTVIIIAWYQGYSSQVLRGLLGKELGMKLMNWWKMAIKAQTTRKCKKTTLNSSQ